MPPFVDGYDELRLRIDGRGAGAYRVLASTRSAEAAATFRLPFNELEIENFILRVSRPRGRRRVDTSALGEAQRFGGGLFKALFTGGVHDLYRDTLTQARGLQRGVRLTLCLSGVPELIDVPWEYLYDEPSFLAVSAFTPVVRYLDLPRAHRPLLVDPPLRVLGVISSPADYEQLDVDRERANLERALSPLIASEAVELHWLERPATLGALLKALQAGAFHALHYVGHGAYERDAERGVLLFENDAGWSVPVSGDKLGTVVHDSSLRLVTLNACEGARSARSDPFAGVAGALVRRDIPAVVAMQFEISDEAAIVFASGFYESLTSGMPVDASLGAARLAMLAERSDDIEWGTPVLFMRVPDGRIFDLGNGAGPRRVPAHAPGVARGGGGAQRGEAPRVFINYRREDTSGHALLLADRLRQSLGAENVHLAPDHGSELDRLAQVQACDVFLALVGPAWLSQLKAASANRHVEDWVRREIEWALRDRSDRVITVVLDGPPPDPESLPRSLRGLFRHAPVELRHGTFDEDVGGLRTRIERVAGGSSAPAPSAGTAANVATDGPTGRSQRAAGVPEPYRAHYAEVIEGMLDGSVVPILGPVTGAGMTEADQLAAPLAERFGMSAAGLAEVAQRVAVTLGERRLYTALKELIAAQSQPAEVHRFLAALPALMREHRLPPRPQLIITANYDMALERAFEDVNEPFDYAVYLADSGCFVHVPWGENAAESAAITILEPKRYVGFPIDDDGRLERTIIVKIHGGADGREGGVGWRNNYVVTEDHYIDYLPTQNIQDHLPIQILDTLTGSRCLFMGYPLRSWNARVFLRRIWRGQPISESSWAIEPDPDPLEKAAWSVVGHVELLASPLPDYVRSLRSALIEAQDEREPPAALSVHRAHDLAK
jgi:CHAT domain-containing protein/SIR2-like protein